MGFGTYFGATAFGASSTPSPTQILLTNVTPVDGSTDNGINAVVSFTMYDALLVEPVFLPSMNVYAFINGERSNVVLAATTQPGWSINYAPVDPDDLVAGYSFDIIKDTPYNIDDDVRFSIFAMTQGFSSRVNGDIVEFTIGITAPEIIYSSPADGATNASRASRITIHVKQPADLTLDLESFSVDVAINGGARETVYSFATGFETGWTGVNSTIEYLVNETPGDGVKIVLDRNTVYAYSDEITVYVDCQTEGGTAVADDLSISFTVLDFVVTDDRYYEPSSVPITALETAIASWSAPTRRSYPVSDAFRRSLLLVGNKYQEQRSRAHTVLVLAYSTPVGRLLDKKSTDAKDRNLLPLKYKYPLNKQYSYIAPVLSKVEDLCRELLSAGASPLDVDIIRKYATSKSPINVISALSTAIILLTILAEID